MGLLKVLFVVSNCFFFLMGIAMVGVAAWAISTVGSVITWMPVLIAVGGGIIVVITIAGFIGCSYDKEQKHHDWHWFFMVAYFIIMMVAFILLIVMGILCVISYDKVKGIVYEYKDTIIASFKNFWPAGTYITADAVVDLVQSNLKIVGGIAIGFGALLVLGELEAMFILGGHMVVLHTLTFGNFVVFACGGLLIAFSVYTFVAVVFTGKAIPLVIMVAGCVLMLVALFGLLGASCKWRVCLIIYAILMIFLSLLILTCGGVLFGFTPYVSWFLTTECNGTNLLATTCQDIMVNVYNFTNTSNINDTITWAVGMISGNMRMVAVAAVAVGSLIVYMIVCAFILQTRSFLDYFDDGKTPLAKKPANNKQPAQQQSLPGYQNSNGPAQSTPYGNPQY